MDNTVITRRTETFFGGEPCSADAGTANGAAGLLSASTIVNLAVMSPSSHIDVSPTAVIPPTATAGDVDPETLTSNTCTMNGGAADVRSINSHTTTPIRVSPGAATRTSRGVTNTRASNDTLPIDGLNKVDAGSTVMRLLVSVLPLLALLLLASNTRSRGRTRLPAQRMPRRRRPAFRTRMGYWTMALFLGGETCPVVFAAVRVLTCS